MAVLAMCSFLTRSGHEECHGHTSSLAVSRKCSRFVSFGFLFLMQQAACSSTFGPQSFVENAPLSPPPPSHILHFLYVQWGERSGCGCRRRAAAACGAPAMAQTPPAQLLSAPRQNPTVGTCLRECLGWLRFFLHSVLYERFCRLLLQKPGIQRLACFVVFVRGPSRDIRVPKHARAQAFWVTMQLRD